MMAGVEHEEEDGLSSRPPPAEGATRNPPCLSKLLHHIVWLVLLALYTIGEQDTTQMSRSQ